MLKEWIRFGREKGASDIHLEAGTPVVYRVRGELMPIGDPVSGALLMQEARGLLDASQWQEFAERRSADLSIVLGGMRVRINIYQTVRGLGLAVRLLSSFQASIRDCNLHPDLSRLVDARSGLLLVSGATGSGKSTTLAAMIEEVNQRQARQIIAIESPIEYTFVNRRSFIRSREVPTHSPSYEQAITDSMRENPDVLVIGEMRTPDVMRLTLNAAETGHLVLATLHSATCAEALARICMSFAPEIQSSIRAQLADCLVGVVCQRLEWLPQAQLRIPVCEILVANSAVKSNLRTGQFSQIATSLQAGGEEGMWTFERYQRWLEQKDRKKDWVRPAQATPIAEAPSPRSGTRPHPAAGIPAPMPRPARETVPDGRIEIAIDETAADLDALDDLARRIPHE